MALAEKWIKQHAAENAKQYRAKVRWLAIIYVLLDLISLTIMAIIAWGVRFFITLSQRSNVETLTLAIVFILAAYYVVSTWKGFAGALWILRYSIPELGIHTDEDRQKLEGRKHRAIKSGGDTIYVCLDQAVRVEGKADEPVTWQVADEAGKLGEVVLDGVRITYYPLKEGMDNSMFIYIVNQLEKAIRKRDAEIDLQITQWSSIDEDEASQYYSMVKAFTNLEKQLGKGALWPEVTITEAERDAIQEELRRLVPALRNQAFLPDVEYEVEYSVPVLPDPLGFLQLTRKENRADPVATMGCAGLVMLTVLVVLIVFVFFPPWVPAK